MLVNLVERQRTAVDGEVVDEHIAVILRLRMADEDGVVAHQDLAVLSARVVGQTVDVEVYIILRDVRVVGHGHVVPLPHLADEVCPWCEQVGAIGLFGVYAAVEGCAAGRGAARLIVEFE